jgi:hypothetical protein
MALTGRSRSPATTGSGRGTPAWSISTTRRADRDPFNTEPRPITPAEAACLAIGEGAKAWLIEAAAVGARQIQARMAEAVALARAIDRHRVDEALGVAAVAGRFGNVDRGDPAVRRVVEGRLVAGSWSLVSIARDEPSAGGAPRSVI